MGKRLATGLLATSLLAGMPAAYADNEKGICDDADHCVWIMENHGPHEFDYDVLTQELEGFGQQGKAFLIMLVGDKDPDIAGRSIDILSDGNFSFTREEARKIVQEWPGSNVEKMANLMVKIGSPDVQGRMIESLLSEDRKIRDVARDVLARLRENKKIYQLRSFEHGPLAKAVVESPTRELVQMLAAFPPEKTTPFLKRALGSGDGPSVIAAYNGLYAIDKEMAFRSLLETLNDLGPDRSETAFALAELLRHRNTIRPDGFYLQFAKELSENPEMTLMGRVAGLDALLGGEAFAKNRKVTTLKANSAVRSALRAALQARGQNIHPYEANFNRVFSQDSANSAMMIWTHIQETQQDDGRIYQTFFDRLETLDNIAVQQITLQALGQTENIKTLKYALTSARSQRDKIYALSVNRLADHWADDVRYDAVATSRLLNQAPTTQAPESQNPEAQDPKSEDKPEPFAKSVARLRTEDRKRWTACKVKGKPLTDYVVQLPYFTLEEEVSGSYVKRRFIQTTYPTQNGWFVGFSAKRNGGLWYFDNESGLGDPVSGAQISKVSSVIPMRLPQPGRYASDFWVISADPTTSGDGQLFVGTQNQTGIRAKLHRYLPRSDFEVSILEQGRYLLTHDNHSPLILGADGTIRPACE